MESHYEIKGNALVIYVPKELDHHVASEIQKEVDGMIDAHHIQRVIFNFQETEFMDSSGVGVILGRYRKLYFLKGKVVAMNILHPRVERIFRISGLHKMIEVEYENA